MKKPWPDLKQFIEIWTPLVLWVGVVLAIGSSTALPMREGNTLRLLLRKGIHVAEYAVLGWLIYRAVRGESRGFQPRLALLSLLIVMGVGSVDEWHQTFVPGRSGTLIDVGLDTVGASLGVLFPALASPFSKACGVRPLLLCLG